jgi:hypothetical protein
MDLDKLELLLMVLRKYNVRRFAGTGAAYPFEIEFNAGVQEPLDKPVKTEESPKERTLEDDLFMKG